MKTVKKGIKGTDDKMKCRGFQYEIGKVYSSEATPRVCHDGFHYCNNITDCYEFYPNNGKNRYFIVDILGDVDEGLKKSSTNKIKFIKEVFPDKISVSDDEFILELNNKGYILAGSRALIYNGFDIKREPHDFDFITTKPKIQIEEDFSDCRRIERFSGNDFHYCFIDLLGRKIEVMQTSEISVLKREYNGIMFKIQDSNIIWETKLKYALDGSLKHINDIKNCNAMFKFYQLSNTGKYCTDDIPF